MMISINKVESTNDLFGHYHGQTQRQGCFVELDCLNAKMSASYNSEIGNAIPFSVWHGHDKRFCIDLMKANTANELMKELLPMAERVVEGYESKWDGNNHIAIFSEDAEKAILEIEQKCEEQEGDLEEWDATEWLCSVVDSKETFASLEGIGIIRKITTDDELSEMAGLLDVMAEKEGIILHGVDTFLEELRTNCEEISE